MKLVICALLFLISSAPLTGGLEAEGHVSGDEETHLECLLEADADRVAEMAPMMEAESGGEKEEVMLEMLEELTKSLADDLEGKEELQAQLAEILQLDELVAQNQVKKVEHNSLVQSLFGWWGASTTSSGSRRKRSMAELARNQPQGLLAIISPSQVNPHIVHRKRQVSDQGISELLEMGWKHAHELGAAGKRRAPVSCKKAAKDPWSKASGSKVKSTWHSRHHITLMKSATFMKNVTGTFNKLQDEKLRIPLTVMKGMPKIGGFLSNAMTASDSIADALHAVTYVVEKLAHRLAPIDEEHEDGDEEIHEVAARRSGHQQPRNGTAAIKYDHHREQEKKKAEVILTKYTVKHIEKILLMLLSRYGGKLVENGRHELMWRLVCFGLTQLATTVARTMVAGRK